jgi:hypothetical protein
MYVTLTGMTGQGPLLARQVFEAEIVEEERCRYGALARAIRAVAARTRNKVQTVKSAQQRHRLLRKFVRWGEAMRRDVAEIERRCSGMRSDVKKKLALLPPVVLLDLLRRNEVDGTSGPTWLVDFVAREDWDPDDWDALELMHPK